MSRIHRFPTLLIMLGCACLQYATAQPFAKTPPSTGASRQIIDGVAAVVGNEVILISDVLQQTLLLAQQQKGLDVRDPQTQREVLNAIIDEKLVVTRAMEDSVTVTDDEVTRYVDRQIERLVEQLGSQERVEQVYGMPMARIRQDSRELAKQQLLADRVRQKKFEDVKPTELDMQEFYRLYKDSLPEIPEQVELQQIVLKVKPSEDARKRTLALAKSIIDSIKAGGDFADFAKRYSVDPGSAANGGDLGFVGSGKFIKEFEDAVRKLGINEISDPVQTQYGIHIIQVLDRRPDATRSRHILLRIEQTGSEKDSLISKLNALRARALAGESFDSLAIKYSEDNETRALGGSLGRVGVDQIPADFKRVVSGMKVGDVSEPLPMMVSPTKSGFEIVRLVKRIPPHKLDPSEDRAQLERMASFYKQKVEYAKWIAQLRNEIYWEIKSPDAQ